MISEDRLKTYAEECKKLSGAELEFRWKEGAEPAYRKIALEEIHRRQKIKEQKTDNTQNSIKNLTIIILILTFLIFVITIAQLLK